MEPNKHKESNTVKDRKPSTSLAIKALGRTIKTLEAQKAITPAEAGKLKEIHKGIVSRWIGLELGE